jgi:hypothetical protein
MELSNWVEQRGSADVADNVRGALEAIDRNEEFIKMTLAVMMMRSDRDRPRVDLNRDPSRNWPFDYGRRLQT